jgi:hypothetical protein
MALPGILQTIVTFLRAGYPEGVPEHDYIPLFALLRRQLSDDELAAVLHELDAEGGRPSSAAIEEAIRDHSPVEPTDVDVARVRSKLAAAGWPLATVPEIG